MRRKPTLAGAMTPFPHSVDINAPIDEAQSFLREHKIRHLPVTDEGVLVGVITDRDIKLMLGPDFAYPEPQALKVSDAMVEETYVVDLKTPLAEVLRTMASKRLGSAIVTRNGKLAGVFTSTDACRAFAELLAPEESTSPDDAA
ncbi:MAG: CBS domain-containing protein [Gammaproteobacteria bacterium]|jgi:acetoin utilization protein AcuB